MRRAFTLIELLVVISIIALLIAILLPALGQARLSARKMQNSVSLRSLHQASVVYGMENNDWYPGLGPDGKPLSAVEIYAKINNPGYKWPAQGTYVRERFALLVFDDFIAYEHLVSPQEVNSTRLVWDGLADFSHRYISYATLDLAGAGSDSRKAWEANADGQTPIFCDRNTDTTAQSPPSADPGKSYWDEDKWVGGVVWNDGHTTFENSPVMSRTSLSTRDIVDDPLFDDPTNSELGRNRGQHVRMLKFNDSKTYGQFANTSIAP